MVQSIHDGYAKVGSCGKVCIYIHVYIKYVKKKKKDPGLEMSNASCAFSMNSSYI